jgi:hypothetical protein
VQWHKNGTAGHHRATQMVTSYFDPATQLIYAIGAVVGLIGGKVYNKFSSGDQILARRQRIGLYCIFDCSNCFTFFCIYGMNTYNINKGIGKNGGVQGLKAQYLFIFAGGFAQDAYPDNDLVHDWRQFLSVSL